MRKIQRVPDGDLRINEPSDVAASVRGSLVVERGRVTVSGHVSGDVIVESGKTVITGSVGGSVRNIGGVVVIEGTVGGSVEGEDDYTTIAPGAIVRNGTVPGLDSSVETAEPAVLPAADHSVTEARLPMTPPVAQPSRSADAIPLAEPSRRSLPTWVPGFAVFIVATAAVVVVGLFFLDRSTSSNASTTTESSPPVSVSVPKELLPPIATTISPTATAPTTSSPTATVNPEVQSVHADAIAMLESLTVAQFMLPPEDFNQDDYIGWFDADDDCQSTRNEVLIAEAIGNYTLDPTGCKVERGRWIDPWTGDLITEPNNAVIEPIIPLSHAHAAGAWEWSAAQKRRFANDLDAAALNVVTGVLTADRRGDTPADWRPPPAAWCNYGIGWIRTKWRWNLPVLEAERDALREMIDSCLDGSPIAIPPEFLEPAAERQR